MRKILVAVLAVLTLTMQTVPVFAAFSSTTEAKAKEEIPANAEAEKVAALKQGNLSVLTSEEILALDSKSYQKLTGNKLSFKEKVVLRYVQRSMKKDIKKEGAVDVKRYFEDGDRSFRLGGFALGLLLGLIGVALAHIFSNDKAFRRSSWYGLGVLLIVLVVAAAAGGGN